MFRRAPGTRHCALRMAAAAGATARLPPAATPAPEPVATSARPISIAIEGAPAGARILFDGAEVTQLPIRVMPRGVMVPLRVEAEGRVPFSRMLSLDRDMVVQVEMPDASRPVAPAAVRRGRNAPVGAGLSKATTPTTTPPSAVEKRPSAKRFLTDTSEFGGPQ